MVGIRPRSRWTNRDDSSYKENSDGTESLSESFRGKKSNSKKMRFNSNYSTTKKYAGSKLYLISQIFGISFLIIFFSGLNNTSPNFANISLLGMNWKSSSNVLILLISVGLIYILSIFRISISGKVPKKRKKKTRNRFILYFLIAVYIYINYN